MSGATMAAKVMVVPGSSTVSVSQDARIAGVTSALPEGWEAFLVSKQDFQKLLMDIRRARLAEVDALEQVLGINPRTSDLRRIRS